MVGPQAVGFKNTAQEIANMFEETSGGTKGGLSVRKVEGGDEVTYVLSITSDPDATSTRKELHQFIKKFVSNQKLESAEIDTIKDSVSLQVDKETEKLQKDIKKSCFPMIKKILAWILKTGKDLEELKNHLEKVSDRAEKKESLETLKKPLGKTWKKLGALEKVFSKKLKKAKVLESKLLNLVDDINETQKMKDRPASKKQGNEDRINILNTLLENLSTSKEKKKEKLEEIKANIRKLSEEKDKYEKELTSLKEQVEYYEKELKTGS